MPQMVTRGRRAGNPGFGSLSCSRPGGESLLSASVWGGLCSETAAAKGLASSTWGGRKQARNKPVTGTPRSGPRSGRQAGTWTSSVRARWEGGQVPVGVSVRNFFFSFKEMFLQKSL